MALRTLRPQLGTPDRSVAKLPPKAADPFYKTTNWAKLRQAVFDRDGPMCAVPTCKCRAVVVDHIVSRRNGGTDDVGNLRGLCAAHDARVKEDATGARRNGGRFEPRSCHSSQRL